MGANFKTYRRSPFSDFKEFPWRPHYLCGERGWEEIADYTPDLGHGSCDSGGIRLDSSLDLQRDELGTSA